MINSNVVSFIENKHFHATSHAGLSMIHIATKSKNIIGNFI